MGIFRPTKALESTIALAIVLCTISISISSIESKQIGFRNKGQRFRPDSRIFFISPTRRPYAAQSYLLNAVTGNSVTSKSSTVNNIRSAPISSNFRLSSMKNFYSPLADKRQFVSTIYKLPLRFISNAKPVDIITGFTKQSNKANGVKTRKNHPKQKQPSKMIYIPVKYNSNGKATKVTINKITQTFRR